MKKSTLKKHKKNKHKSCVNGNIESNRAQNNKRLGDCAKDKVLRGSGIMISGISHFQTKNLMKKTIKHARKDTIGTIGM